MEHPDIEQARRTGYPTKNTLTAMSAYENNNRGHYTTSEDDYKMLSSYAYDELHSFRNTYHKLYQYHGVIGINLDENELRVNLKNLSVFIKESEGHHVEIEKNDFIDNSYLAMFRINKVKFLLYMNEKETKELEGLLDE